MYFIFFLCFYDKIFLKHVSLAINLASLLLLFFGSIVLLHMHNFLPEFSHESPKTSVQGVHGCDNKHLQIKPHQKVHVKGRRRRFGITSVVARLHFTPWHSFPFQTASPRQRDCHYDHYRRPFSLCPPSKGLLVLLVAWLLGSSPLAHWLLTPGLAHSLAPAPSIRLITAMKAVQTEAGIRAN